MNFKSRGFWLLLLFIGFIAAMFWFVPQFKFADQEDIDDSVVREQDKKNPEQQAQDSISDQNADQNGSESADTTAEGNDAPVGSGDPSTDSDPNAQDDSHLEENSVGDDSTNKGKVGIGSKPGIGKASGTSANSPSPRKGKKKTRRPVETLPDPNDPQFLDKVEKVVGQSTSDEDGDINLVEQYQRVLYRNGKTRLNLMALFENSPSFRELNPLFKREDALKAKDVDAFLLKIPPKEVLEIMVPSGCDWGRSDIVKKYSTVRDREQLRRGQTVKVKFPLEKKQSLAELVAWANKQSCITELTNQPSID